MTVNNLLLQNDLNLIPPAELGRGSGIRLEVCETEQDLYWKMAIEVFDLIKENNHKKEKTVMIVPYGPLGPYSRLVWLINKYRLSLRECCFINMDEYLTADGTAFINKDHPLSFRGGMDRIFYGLVDSELNLKPENRIFPEPGKEDLIWKIILKAGKLDMCFGGVGINGHIAFNEPPEPGEHISNEDFRKLPSRVLKLSRETRTINAFMNCGGDLDGIPPYCITVGMKEIWYASKVRMLMPRDWNAGALRKVLHGKPAAAVPCSLFQEHADAKLYAAEQALTSPVPKIRIYNK